jgi:hypothetical protein
MFESTARSALPAPIPVHPIPKAENSVLENDGMIIVTPQFDLGIEQLSPTFCNESY